MTNSLVNGILPQEQQATVPVVYIGPAASSSSSSMTLNNLLHISLNALRNNSRTELQSRQGCTL